MAVWIYVHAAVGSAGSHKYLLPLMVPFFLLFLSIFPLDVSPPLRQEELSQDLGENDRVAFLKLSRERN